MMRRPERAPDHRTQKTWEERRTVQREEQTGSTLAADRIGRLPLAGMGEGWQRRTKVCVAGTLVQGFFLSFLIKVNLGTDPYTFMNVSIADRIGWTFGNWQLTINAVLLLFVVLTSRLRYLGFGTLANMVLIGYTADLGRYLWTRLFPAAVFTEAATRIPIFAVALIGFLIAAAVYMNAGMGLSPYDAPPSILHEHAGKLPYFIVRIVWDYGAVLIGVLVGGTPTVSNLIMAIALGPVVTLIGKVMRRGRTQENS